jgi:hypothetical protein
LVAVARISHPDVKLWRSARDHTQSSGGARR